ncbi:MAG: HNH endonuclease [Candidatus Krumholzibacteria bacterium]|nr:HNH endonuclease [Candidatus Krumholzibacteria bacterium]
MSLRSLPDRVILSRTLEFVRRERSATLDVLRHLSEIERRKLHLKQGYASMFAYCTQALGYSESAAVRRIRSARCATRFPEVYELLEAGDVNLCTVSIVYRFLKPDTRDRLLESIRGCSQAQVRDIVAALQPCPMPAEVIRPLVVQKEARPAPALLESGLASAPAASVPHVACENIAYRRSGGNGPGPLVAVATEKRTQLSFTVGEAFMGKLNRIKSLAWHRLPVNPSLEQAFELAMDVFLDKHDPAARQVRRENRRTPEPARTPSLREPNLRHVSAAVRDQVFIRDQGCCTYVGANGRVCGSKRGLQFDHVVPVARGGGATADNLRLLCAYHNRLEAARLGLPAGPSHERPEVGRSR